jgi:hypothetical protein
MPPVWTGSPGDRLPVIVVGGQIQVGTENEIVDVPPANVSVSVKFIVVPHTKLAGVVTENGTIFVEVPFSSVFG